LEFLLERMAVLLADIQKAKVRFDFHLKEDVQLQLFGHPRQANLEKAWSLFLKSLSIACYIVKKQLDI
jgi:hypothetical protein